MFIFCISKTMHFRILCLLLKDISCLISCMLFKFDQIHLLHPILSHNLQNLGTISEANAQNSKQCKSCLPQCTDKTYGVQIESTRMDDVGYDSEIT